MTENHATNSDIALIGMAGRFPGAPDLETFWQNVRDGVESIVDLTTDELLSAGIDPALWQKPDYVRRRARLDGIDLFAASFFGYTPREAVIMDPQQRIFLECAWHALEDAGYDPERLSGPVGVYAGSSMNTYLFQALQDPEIAASLGSHILEIGNAPDFLTLRVSYKLNLRGPSVVVQTACSTSLTAVHMACQSLLNGECDMALAGGVSIFIPQGGYLYREGGIAAPDGHCRAFDAEARGTVPGNGAGVVVLKRLEDALAERDVIRAIIKGSAMNNDGSRKVGFTAPSSEGQAAVIIESQALAGIDPDTISYIEAHGTGTPLGDPIEVQALTRAFRTAGSTGTGFCALGSLKTNIGHLDAAAGVAGLIKTVLALQHRQLPPSLHFQQPNPACELEGSPFYVNTHLRPWSVEDSGGVRRAGVSSFGIGGTNVHVLLEEAPPRPVRASSQPGPYILLLSAKTPTALEQMTARFTRHMARHPALDLADVAATLQLGRGVFPYRRFLIAQNSQEIQEAGEDWISGEQHQRDQPVAFLFPGQGSLLVGRGAELYQTEPVFRQTFNRCAEILRPYLDLDIHMLLHPPSERKAQIEALWQETACAQPLQFVLSYALAQLWQQRGVYPQMMLGHSLGEYVAACLAGVFSLEDALRLIACRGALMQKMPVGAMLSVALSPQATQERLMPGLEIAALNGEELTVVSGPRALVEEWRRQLSAENIVCQPLHVTRAFHSALLEPMLPAFLQEMRQIKLHEPRIPYISNLSGTWITASQATDPGYWGEQLRKPVQFLRGLQTLQERTPAALLEVGPGTSLTGLARRYQQRTPSTRRPALVASMPHPKDTRHERAVLLEAVGHLWLAGVSLKWEALAGSQWQRVCLPTYPFERHAFWHKAEVSRSQAARQTPAGQPSPLSLREAAPIQRSEESGPAEISYVSQIEEIIASVWSELIGVSPVEREADFFELGGDSMVASLAAARFTERFGVKFPLRLLFEQPTVAALAIAVEEMLLEQLAALEQEVHAWPRLESTSEI